MKNLCIMVAAVASIFYAMEAVAFDGASVYLISQIEKDGALSLGDISRIDADRETAVKLRAVQIAPELYLDGYCDRKELERLLAKLSCGPVTIYGSAVRISGIVAGTTSEEEAEKEALDEPIVKKGDAVSVTLRNRGILLHLTGSALQDGKKGEEIAVRIKGNHTLKGRVTDKKMVELIL